MSLTKAERQEMMAKAREAKQAKLADPHTELKTLPVVGPQYLGTDMGGPDAQTDHFEYDLAPYEVVKEPHEKGVRFVLLLDGKHQIEWHGDEADCYDRAGKFADSGDRTGEVNTKYDG